MDLGLKNKVAVVTGSSRGLGLAAVRALAAERCLVTLCARSEDRLREAAREVASVAGGDDRVLAVTADVSTAPGIAEVIERTVQTFGGLDVLVNNAGVGLFKNAADMSPAEWQTVIETNLTGVFSCCHAAIPHLRQRGGGWIINISSLAGNNPFAGGTAYCASKAGLNAFSEALMQEVRYDNIRVTCVMPGSVATGFGGRSTADRPDWKIQPEDVGQLVIDLLQMPTRSLPSRIELRPSKPQK
jgi:NAD(P)-dependent dehydrogenase (short-subunit alcohol dehydrogenase family)